jgi:hypothetical protein
MVDEGTQPRAEWPTFHEMSMLREEAGVPWRPETEEPGNRLQGKQCENIFPLASPEIEKMQQK